MKKTIILWVFCCIASIKLCAKPVGLVNCGNTCFQNAFIQMAYQIDPLVDVLSKRQELYMQNTVGYTFQHLVWDIINAQKMNKPVIDCGSVDNPTNLKKLTEGVYTCMEREAGSQGDLSYGFNILMEKLKKTSYQKLVSVLNMIRESTIYLPHAEPYTIPRLVPTVPSILLNDLSGPTHLENYIKNAFVTKKTSWLDPRTKTIYENVDVQYKLLSAPEFIFFMYAEQGQGFGRLKNTTFPNELNFTAYTKGNAQTLYQLRAIGLHIPFGAGGHYIAVAQDRDEKLYVCNDSSIEQVGSWFEGIGTFNPAVFLYVLKKDEQGSSDSKVFIDKLNKLQQSLKRLQRALSNF